MREEKELEDIARRYYTLLRVVDDRHWQQVMTPFWNSQRKAIQKKAEELGVTTPPQKSE